MLDRKASRYDSSDCYTFIPLGSYSSSIRTQFPIQIHIIKSLTIGKSNLELGSYYISFLGRSANCDETETGEAREEETHS